MQFTLSQFRPVENESFVVRRANIYHALNELHSHPELELIHVTEGVGTLIIGDSVVPVTGGELFLIGCDVPHMFRFQEQTFIDTIMRRGEESAQLNLLLLHFDPHTIGENFINVPENRLIKSLIQRANSVLLIGDEFKPDILNSMEELVNIPVHEKLIRLMILLNMIAEVETRPASNHYVKNTFSKSDEARLSKIFLITVNNFHKRVTLHEMAEAVYMSPNAFCNFFKLKTGRTYFDFLLEIRINHACKLLRTADHSIGEICYYSGFSNASNFNRQFKELTAKTPLEYKKQFRIKTVHK